MAAADCSRGFEELILKKDTQNRHFVFGKEVTQLKGLLLLPREENGLLQRRDQMKNWMICWVNLCDVMCQHGMVILLQSKQQDYVLLTAVAFFLML